jgi:hypothetical protein
MKSEKARQELEDGSWKVEVGYEGEDVDLPYHAVRVDVAQYAVELAEQEAEERMRKIAEKAYCGVCFLGIPRECQVSKACCHYLQDFTQKLNENEND